MTATIAHRRPRRYWFWGGISGVLVGAASPFIGLRWIAYVFWFPFDSIMKNIGEARMLFAPLAYFANAFLIGALVGHLWSSCRRRFSHVGGST